MYLGKQVRLERIINRETGRTIIVPMDHGVTIGAVDGLIDMRETVNDMAVGGADAVLMHKGLVRCSHRNAGKDVGLIVHLSASTMLSPQGNTKTLVGTVEEGIKHGADCVSVHVNLGDPNERLMLADLGRVAAACDDWHMPLLAMMYARGPAIKNGFAPDVVAHCARVGVELGADIVKVPFYDVGSAGGHRNLGRAEFPLAAIPAGTKPADFIFQRLHSRKLRPVTASAAPLAENAGQQAVHSETLEPAPVQALAHGA